VHPITKNPLCFVCHGEPGKCQENFYCCCCRPDNAFLCEKKCLGSPSKYVDHVLQGTSKSIPYNMKMRWTRPATMERE